MTLFEVNHLTVSFHTRHGIVRAVRDLSFSVKKGQVLGIVGESGSGKSVTNYSYMRLLPTPPARIESGSAVFNSTDLLKLSPKELRAVRGNRISFIFQDPLTCLNPYMKIGEQLVEPLIIHGLAKGDAAKKKALAMLDEVGILDAPKRFHAYPHEMSGGMRQRVVIAMALITEPDLLIADEPTTALDVTVEAQILDLIKREQKKRNMGVIYITHNLGVIAGLSDRIVVMYAGRVVEQGIADDIFYNPQHPYTRALLNAIPAVHKNRSRLTAIPGQPPDPSRPMPGCSFAPRCPLCEPRCRIQNPELTPCGAGHEAACLLINKEGM